MCVHKRITEVVDIHYRNKRSRLLLLPFHSSSFLHSSLILLFQSLQLDHGDVLQVSIVGSILSFCFLYFSSRKK